MLTRHEGNIDTIPAVLLLHIFLAALADSNIFSYNWLDRYEVILLHAFDHAGCSVIKHGLFSYSGSDYDDAADWSTSSKCPRGFPFPFKTARRSWTKAYAVEHAAGNAGNQNATSIALFVISESPESCLLTADDR